MLALNSILLQDLTKRYRSPSTLQVQVVELAGLLV